MRKPKRHYRNMTPQIAAEIRRAYWSRELNQRQLAEKYGSSQAAVSRIINEECWWRKDAA